MASACETAELLCSLAPLCADAQLPPDRSAASGSGVSRRPFAQAEVKKKRIILAIKMKQEMERNLYDSQRKHPETARFLL
jgi:hypothetical protein